MANIGATSIFFDVAAPSASDLEETATQLFDDWDAYVESNLDLPDYYIALQLEEGSVKAAGRIAAGLGALYIVIGQYGSFVSGVSAIKNQVRAASEYLERRTSDSFGPTSQVSRRGQALSRLESLFEKVRRREMTVDEAMLASQKIFGEELVATPEFEDALRDSLEEEPQYPEQQLIAFAESSDDALVDVENVPPPKRPQPAPKPPPPDPEQFRVEVWRENRRSKRNIRIVRV